MRSDRKILLAFILNLGFSIAEFIGGTLTGSVAIISDALHDFGDAAAIAVSAYLERKSKRPPDEKYTFGYGRFSVVGGAINGLILLFGSVIVISSSVIRLVSPSPIHYDGMIIMAVFGVGVNLLAAYVTHGGHSLNQRAVNLHMLEDVLGWVVVLIGAIVMRFTNWWFIDPIMSMGVAVFILINAIGTLRDILQILLEKSPTGISPSEVIKKLEEIDGVGHVHHIHLWSLDGEHAFATVHIVSQSDEHEAKENVRRALAEIGIIHATIETEKPGEECHGEQCSVLSPIEQPHGHHHHHHNRHHHH